MIADFIYDQNYKNHFFSETEIQFKEFENCTFENCNLSNCEYLGVVFSDCTFIRCNFTEAKINYVALRNCDFIGCQLTSVNFAMTDQVLFDYRFTDCAMDFTQFYGLKMKRMTFTNCSLISADFMKTDLTEVLFDRCNLHLAVFTDSIANKADFYSSLNYSIDPEKTKLEKAIFSQNGLQGLLQKYKLVIR